MNIYEELNKISWKKRDYFLNKFDLFVRRTEPLTEEQLCKRLRIKSLSSLQKWEKSEEYHRLVNLYIESQAAKDLEDIYKLVKDKALTGDEKSIKMLLDLQKQVQSFNKLTKSVAKSVKEDDDMFEDLEYE